MNPFWTRLLALAPSAHLGATPVGHHAALLALPPTKTGRYLEIGTRRGHSLACLLHTTQMTATSVDLFIPNYANEPNPGAVAVRKLLYELDLSHRTAFIQGDSHELLPYFSPGQFDLILVDGDHTPEGAMQDLKDVLPLLAPGGEIWFDDAADLKAVWTEWARALTGFATVEYWADERPWCKAIHLRQETR